MRDRGRVRVRVRVRVRGACLEIEQGERAECEEHSNELAADARLGEVRR